MKKLLLLTSLLATMKFYAASPAPKEVRELYRLAVSDKNSCEKLIALLQPCDEKNNPSMAGYRACATMIMASHVFNPYTKLSHFSEGKNLLEKCITEDQTNIELRFLRFTIQAKSPSFLGYNSSLLLDKTFILRAFPTINDQQLKQLIKSFLMDCNLLTPTEKQNLK